MSGFHREETFEPERDSLTATQLDELKAWADGLTARDAGARRFVSAETVKSHRRAILQKLGASTGAQAVHLAHQRGLLGSAPDHAELVEGIYLSLLRDRR